MLIHSELFSNVSGLGLGLEKIFGPRPRPRPHSFWPRPRPWPHAQLAILQTIITAQMTSIGGMGRTACSGFAVQQTLNITSKQVNSNTAMQYNACTI